jgi:regulator of ribonuclease activity A
MSLMTTDLSDAHPEVQACEPIFRDFGGKAAFHGPIRTLKLFEDNALLRATLETPGEDRVLVVDAGGSLRCAVLGGQLGALAVKNRWTGVLVYGCVRDTVELAGQAVGIKALATHPRKSEKGLHSAHADRPVSFAGVTFRPGAWLYADADGVLVSDTPIHT